MSKSIDGMFTDWVATQPPERPFVYTDCFNCAFALFLKETGICGDPSVTPGKWRDRRGGVQHSFSPEIESALNDVGALEDYPTFGKLTRRIAERVPA